MDFSNMTGFNQSRTPVVQPSSFDDFIAFYDSIHLYVVCCICALGIFCNILNLVTLTRPRMLDSPSNVLLLGLAPAQLCLLLNFMSFSLQLKWLLFNCDEAVYRRHRSYAAILYFLFTVNANIVLHVIVMTHMLLIAVFRFLVVHYPMKTIVTGRRVKISVIGAYCIVPMCCISFWFNSVIVPLSTIDHGNASMNHCGINDSTDLYLYAFSSNKQLLKFNSFYYAIFWKIVPCFATIILSGILCYDLHQVKKSREKLRRRSLHRGADSEARQRQHYMTSVMLLVIVLLFTVVELPQGFMNIIIYTHTRKFFWLRKLFNFMDMLTVTYSSLTFILYCTMSSQFRTAFKSVFCVQPSELSSRLTSYYTLLPGANKTAQHKRSAFTAAGANGANGAKSDVLPPRSKSTTAFNGAFNDCNNRKTVNGVDHSPSYCAGLETMTLSPLTAVVSSPSSPDPLLENEEIV